ncbi:MAG: GNAT family N-acetyltransferase [Candidatus Latescibacterota bacterium]
MSEINFTDDLSGLSTRRLTGFFSGWPSHPDPETHLSILRNSYKVCLALDGDRCVGFINALSDGVFYAYIPLLEVLPDYRGQGIGSELVRRMLESLDGMYAVDIVCDPDVAPFYEKLGFARCVGMIQRKR